MPNRPSPAPSQPYTSFPFVAAYHQGSPSPSKAPAQKTGSQAEAQGHAPQGNRPVHRAPPANGKENQPQPAPTRSTLPALGRQGGWLPARPVRPLPQTIRTAASGRSGQPLPIEASQNFGRPLVLVPSHLPPPSVSVGSLHLALGQQSAPPAPIRPRSWSWVQSDAPAKRPKLAHRTSLDSLCED